MEKQKKVKYVIPVGRKVSERSIRAYLNLPSEKDFLQYLVDNKQVTKFCREATVLLNNHFNNPLDILKRFLENEGVKPQLIWWLTNSHMSEEQIATFWKLEKDYLKYQVSLFYKHV